MKNLILTSVFCLLTMAQMSSQVINETFNFRVDLSHETIPIGFSIGIVRIVGNFNGQIVLDKVSGLNNIYRKINVSKALMSFWNLNKNPIFTFQYEIVNPSAGNRVEFIVKEQPEYPCADFVVAGGTNANDKVIVIGRKYISSTSNIFDICFNKCSTCSNITPVTNPDPYIDASDFFGMEKYLARAINMEEIILQNRIENTFGSGDNFGYRFEDTNTVGTGIINDCNDPCSQNCLIKYCPKKYKEDIDMLPELNAAFIRVGVGFYTGDAVWLNSDPDHYINFPDNNLHKNIYSMAKYVKDVNEAYDASGKRRPIIEAFIPEFIDTAANQSTGLRALENIKIPKKVLIAFFEEMSPSEKAQYFINSNLSTPKDNVKFNYNLMCSRPGIATPETIYLTNLQGRMWIYFLSKQFIDMGYTSIQFSQLTQWTRDLRNIPDGDRGTTDNLPFASVTDTQANKEAHSEDMQDFNWREAMFHLSNLVTKIRQYAKDNSKFILLSTQADRIYYRHIPNVNSNDFVKEFGSNNKPLYIFDYNGAAMRPREVKDAYFNTNIGRNLKTLQGPQLCSQPNDITEATFNSLIPGCNNCLKAIIDPCSGKQYERNGEGWTPRPWVNKLPNDLPSGRYMVGQPHMIYFDGGAGVDEPNPAYFPSICLPFTGTNVDNKHTYGYDDSRWFNEFRSLGGATCINNWLFYEYQNVRKFDFNGSLEKAPTYFLEMPGRVLFRRSKLQDLEIPTSFNLTVPTDVFRLADPTNSSTKNFIKNNLWNVNEVTSTSILVTTISSNTKMFSVVNPDKTSIYSWHIQLLDNNGWVPFTVGLSRTFTNTTNTSYYLVYLRQDNLGLPSNLYGVKQVSMFIVSSSSLIENKELMSRSADGLNKFNIFPNPAQNEIILQSESDIQSIKRIKLLDISGRTVIEEYINSKNTILNISSIVNGSYFLQIFDESNNNIQTEKVIIIK